MDANAHNMAHLLDFTGKTALIAFMPEGMDEALARRYAEAGASVVLVGTQAEALEKAQASVHRALPQAAVQVHIIPPQISASELTVQFAGHEPDIFVYGDFSAHTLRICRACMSARSAGGAVVFVGENSAVLPAQESVPLHSGAAANLRAAVRQLANEYGFRGWRCNAVVPGGIRLPNQPMIAKTSIAQRGRMLVHRIGEPDDVARAVVFLASNAATFINGAVLPVDGSAGE